jgi:hypothetical protein
MELSGLDETSWDVIMFHHSFEHMSEPHATLSSVARLMSRDGCCLIRIPVVAWSWERYGVNWVQLDAPRHQFLYTERGFRLLAESAGLKVTRVHYDSTSIQFWGSELYARNIAQRETDWRNPRKVFSRGQIQAFESGARDLNDSFQGDQAAFYLVRV